MLKVEAKYPGGGLPREDARDHRAGHWWRVFYAILIEDHQPDPRPYLPTPSHPATLAFTFAAPTAADALVAADVKLQEHRLRRLHAGDTICAYRLTDLQWVADQTAEMIGAWDGDGEQA